MNLKPSVGTLIGIAAVCLAVAEALQCVHAESNLHFRLVDSTLIVVSVNSDKGSSFEFVLDTGTDTTVIDPSIASKLSFVAMERIRVVSLRDINLAVRGSIPSLSAGSFQVNDLVVLVKDLSGMRRLDSRIVGIVGQNFLSHFNYLIDYGRHLVCIEPGNEIRGITDGDRVAIEPTENRMLVHSEAQSRENAKLRLVLDSGARSVVLLRTASQKLSIPRQGSALEETSDGQAELEMGRVRLLTVGSQEFHNIAALLLAFEPGVQMGDGLLPTILFRAVYVNNHDGFVVFNPRMPEK